VRLNQTELAEKAQGFLSRLSPGDKLSREIIRKYEDEKHDNYQLLSDNPARAIAIAEALDVEPTWLVPDLPLTPEGAKHLKGVLEDLVQAWPVTPARAVMKPAASKKTTKRGK
jgi:hypothetical protein